MNHILKIFITTTGCMSMRMDTVKIETYLKENEYLVVSNPKEADIFLMSSCVVTKYKEDLSFKYLDKFNSEKKKVVIIGCGAIMLPEHFSDYIVLKDNKEFESFFPPKKLRLTEVEYSGDPSDFGYIPPYIHDSIDNYRTLEGVLLRLSDALASSFRYGTTGFEFYNELSPFFRVLASKGCNYTCSYCIVWKARGPYTSVPINSIISQIKKGHSNGYKKFILVADELTSYGVDIEGKYLLGLLLKRIRKTFPDIKLALRYFEPMRILKLWNDVKEYITDESISYLSIPIQSGSEAVLQKIKRKIDLINLKSVINEIRQKYKGPILTHVIVGFEHETEDDILKTSKYLINADFDDVDVQVFSPRPGSKDENIKIHNNWKKHRDILRETRKHLRARYLMKSLSNPNYFDEKAIQTEKEFRFPLKTLPYDFIEYLKMKTWKECAREVDIVLMHEDFDGFVARIRKDAEYHLQFKIRQELRVWKEISIKINKEEVLPVFKALSEFLDPKVVVIKNRKKVKENDSITLFMDEVDSIGTFVEIEGKDNSVDVFMHNLGIDSQLSAEPYGKIILQNNLDISKKIQDALKLMST